MVSCGWAGAVPQPGAKQTLLLSNHTGFVGCSTPGVHTHCQPARRWTEAGGEVDRVTNFHSDSC